MIGKKNVIIKFFSVARTQDLKWNKHHVVIWNAGFNPGVRTIDNSYTLDGASQIAGRRKLKLNRRRSHGAG